MFMTGGGARTGSASTPDGLPASIGRGLPTPVGAANGDVWRGGTYSGEADAGAARPPDRGGGDSRGGDSNGAAITG
jgi:hypothetical protein